MEPRVAAGAIFDLQLEAAVFFVVLDDDAAERRAERLGKGLEALAVREILAIGTGNEQRRHDLARMPATLHRLHQLLVGRQPLQQLLEVDTGQFDAGRRDFHRTSTDGTADQVFLEVAFVLDVGFRLPTLHAEQRRLRDVDVAVLDHLGKLAIEEREQQRPDVRAVDVCVRHDDDAVVAQLADVEVLGADSAAERRDHRLDFVAAEHLVEAGLLDVEDLALERQDRLEAAVAPLLGRSTCRLTFDDVEFALRGVAFLAVGQLARQ